MIDKEHIEDLLTLIRELEQQIAEKREAEILPIAFFDQLFQSTYQILRKIQHLEQQQMEQLQKQIEEHQRLVDLILSEQAIRQSMESKIVTQEATISPEESTNPAEETILTAEEPLQEEELIEQVKAEPAAKPIDEVHPITETILEKNSDSLNDLMEKKNLSDFRKAFSLNDRFRFRRELFNGNEALMNQAIATLNDLASYEESIAYLNNVLHWNMEDDSVADFIKLLEKRFS